MDGRLAKFSDRQIAQMMGALNDGVAGIRNRLICEASYRLVRANGAAMTDEEEELIDLLMTADFRLREKKRQRRREVSKRVFGDGRAAKSGRGGTAASKIRCIR